MPVQQHPIPQNVTQYQFRLVGDMTLKQFLQLAGGILIAVLFYASPLPFFLKWPLIIIFSSLGASLAFLPVEGRPLDQWILAFFRSIYAPTIYTWQKPGSPITPTPAFSTPPVDTSALPVMAKPTPSPAITPNVASSSPAAIPSPLTSPIAQPAQPTIPAPASPPLPKEEVTPAQPTPTTNQNVPQTSSHPISVSSPNIMAVEKKFTPPSKEEEAPTISVSAPTHTDTRSVTAATPITTSSSLPIPHPPQTPNTLVGMTLTQDGKILDSAIIEVLENGATIRATKSNKLGQFLFAKPLDNGVFHVTASKDAVSFPVFELDLKGQIVPPIKLQALA